MLLATCLTCITHIVTAGQAAPLADHRGPFIEASPCPVPFGPGLGTTVIRWDSSFPSSEVTVKASGREQRLSTLPSGQQKIDWINIDTVYEFRLYRGLGRKDLVATVDVTRKFEPDDEESENLPVPISTPVSKIRTAELFVAFELLALGMIGLCAWRERSGRAAQWLYPAGVVMLAGVLGAVNLAWLEHFRRGMPIDIDESQFYVDAIDQAGALRHGEYDNFIELFEHADWHSPLLPLSLALCQAPLGDDPFLGYAVLQAYYIILLLATYGIARRFTTPPAALLATMVLASSPGIIYYCRTFFVELPTAALFTAAIYAMLCSEQGRRLKWALAMGVAVGLTNLMRPVCLALVPGFFVALGLQCILSPGDRRRRIIHIAVACLVGILTTGLWYFYFHDPRHPFKSSNLADALDYLTSYGYGQNTTFYNDGGVSLNRPLAVLTYRLRVIVNQGFFLPLATVLSLLAIVGLNARYVRRSGPWMSKERLRSAMGSNVATLGMLTAYVYAMLTSSLNEGDGFMLVVLPVFAVAPIAVFYGTAGRWPQSVAAAGLVLLGIWHVAMQADCSKYLVSEKSVTLPEIGTLRISSGSGRVHESCRYVGFTGPPTLLPAEYRQWMQLNNQVLDHIRSQTKLKHAQVVVGLRDPVFNFSTLDLASRTDFKSRMDTVVFKLDDKLAIGHQATVKDHCDLIRAHLTNRSFAHADRIYLVFGEQTPFELQPAVNQVMSAEAAKQMGFMLGETLLMPDGRHLSIWERRR
jgi:hypothetical protein